ncbi:MAG: hypothetical protein A2W29_04550 [Gemmatimonadetes bacterium RBG_16_66_8]|nr:MAG: hypothetical protein A2W29_04550 [Gemmatimonadetes bacterium RBG_16_66_8]
MKPQRQSSKRSWTRWLFVTALVLAFGPIPSPLHAFDGSGHDQATDGSIPGVSSDAMEQFKNANKATDSPEGEPNPADHFDRPPNQTSKQAFKNGVRNVQALKAAAISAIQACNTELAFQLIGQALHAIQDFYAHSNFVDLSDADQAKLVALFEKDADTITDADIPNDVRLCAYYPIPNYLDRPDLNPRSYNPSSSNWLYGGKGYLESIGMTVIIERDPRPGAENDFYDHGWVDGKHKDVEPILGKAPGDGARNITRGTETKSAWQWAQDAARAASLAFINSIINEVGTELWGQKFQNYRKPDPIPPDPCPPIPPPPSWPGPWNTSYPYDYALQCPSCPQIAWQVPAGGGICESCLGSAVFIPSASMTTSTWFHLTLLEPASFPYFDGVKILELREFWPMEEFSPPLMIGIEYDLGELGGIDPAGLSIYRFDVYGDSVSTWQLVPGAIVDSTHHTVYAPVSPLGLFALCGTVPTSKTTTSSTVAHQDGAFSVVVLTATGIPDGHFLSHVLSAENVVWDVWGVTVSHEAVGGETRATITGVLADRAQDGHVSIMVGSSAAPIVEHWEVDIGRNTADVPGSTPWAFRLEPVRPNPTTGQNIVVHFVLPSAAPARLEMVDVAGRIVSTQEVGALGAGPHAVNLEGARRLRPGMYLVRLSQGVVRKTTRAVIIR